MKIESIRTEKIVPFKDDIFIILDKYLVDMPNHSVLAITSKVISICEGNVVLKDGVDKDEIAKKEADYYLPREEN